MAQRDKPHLIVPNRPTTFAYAPITGRGDGSRSPAPPDRRQHGLTLRTALESVASDAALRRDQSSVVVEDAVAGAYAVFESFPGIELALDSLDPRKGKNHPELRSVRTGVLNGQTVELATVFVPEGGMSHFITRVTDYLATLEDESPKNSNLLERIRSVRLASIEALWTDSTTEFPRAGDTVWWEVWLRNRDGGELDRLRTFAAAVDVTVGRRSMGFGSRTVVLVQASAEQLASAVDVLDDLAELRAPHEPGQFLADEDAVTQAEWVRDLEGRVTAADDSAPAVCVVDTGVHRAHPLLSASLASEDCHVADPLWPKEIDDRGHGTQMAGLSLYGDLGEIMTAQGRVVLKHRLESLKLLPPRGANPPELYGAITAAGTSSVEIQSPHRRRVFSMPITATPAHSAPGDATDPVLGQPTSWSAAIDALAAGRAVTDSDDGVVLLNAADENAHRLFVVSAGNVDTFQDDHLVRSDIEPIEDPAQAWNVLTVGAFTNLDTITHAHHGYTGWTPLAPRGELSPFSRTSVAFSKKWPVKPEVVMEGGNLARSPNGTEFHTLDDLGVLTTRSPAGQESASSSRWLTTANATSAATAQAARLAAQIMVEYPSLWPETIRALIVHSAEWTPGMRAQLDAKFGKRAKRTVLRRYGMGVPDLARATRSATDALTLIAQDTILPFRDGKMREIHFHDLPWPTDALMDLGEVTVRLRVTLSYFIEPNPARRGWNGRYSYASHGLRFDVRRATESNDDFHKRLNRKALAEEETRPDPAGDSGDWFFGAELQRSSGSLHTDIWSGSAVELAQRGSLAVFPVGGWWKDRPKRECGDDGARYSLVVSIETPAVDTDIWTPVAQQIHVPIAISSK